MFRKYCRIFHIDQNGLTLIEILIVISIIGILSAGATLLVSNHISKSKETVLETNLIAFDKMMSAYAIDFKKTEWYDEWNNNGDGSLNNFIELEWEVINDGHYENNVSMVNPYSQKMSILDYSSTLGSGDGYRPAVFMTANSNYSYTGSGNTNNIIGTIVAYFDVSGDTTEYIELYYVKEDGTKSDTTFRLD